MFNSYLLIFLIILPTSWLIILLFLPNNINFLKKIQIWTFIIFLLIFFFSLFLLINFNKSIPTFQFIFYIPNIINTFNIDFILGIDGISLFFILLTTFLFPICLLTNWTNYYFNQKFYIIMLLLLEIFLILIFSCLDLFFFYIFFELSLLPMVFLIGIWGNTTRKVKAIYFFFFFTLLGSFLMLLGIIFIYLELGTTNLILIYLLNNFSKETQLILWLTFFFSFAIKLPMFPLHIWLPEAHVQAPTTGSVLLAGILLKLGGYGFLRITIPLFSYANIYYYPIVFTLCTIGIVYTSLTTLRQIDLKKIIAYSSISHMNYVIIGIFSLNQQAIEGAILLMFGHGLVSSCFFLLVGILYERYHTRYYKYFSGLAQIMPKFALFFFIFSFSNISFPCTCNFIGEFLILLGVLKINLFITILIASSIILSSIYSILLFNRICFGNLKINYIKTFLDLQTKEIFYFLPFIFLILFLGIYPQIFLDYIQLSIKTIL